MNTMNTEESSDTIFSMPQDTWEIAESVNQKLLPPKSQKIYEAGYIIYKKSKKSNKINLYNTSMFFDLFDACFAGLNEKLYARKTRVKKIEKHAFSA